MPANNRYFCNDPFCLICTAEQRDAINRPARPISRQGIVPIPDSGSTYVVEFFGGASGGGGGASGPIPDGQGQAFGMLPPSSFPPLQVPGQEPDPRLSRMIEQFRSIFPQAPPVMNKSVHRATIIACNLPDENKYKKELTKADTDAKMDLREQELPF